MARAVSPVIGVVLLVGVTLILTAAVAVFVFDTTSILSDPTPQVSSTDTAFDTSGGQTDQTVRITHQAGDPVPVSELELIVEATGPDLDTQATLTNLPADGSSLDGDSVQGNDALIDSRAGFASVLTAADTNTWTSGDTITFRITKSTADFTPDGSPDATQLDVTIVHRPTNSILTEHTFTPTQ